MDEIFAYVRAESGDVGRAERSRLSFIRTAQVGDARYWLWSYKELDGEGTYVTCRVEPDGSMEFFSQRLERRWKLQLYLVKGLADASPDTGGGVVLQHLY